MPDFSIERHYWDKGISVVGGVDEVGRGAFAGPVFAACVGFDSGMVIPSSVTINDSKKVTQKVRESSTCWIKKKAMFVGVGRAEVSEINKYGIVNATNRAFRRAVINAEKDLQKRQKDNCIKHLLVDGFGIPYIKGVSRDNQTVIVRGDSKSISIAAASIVAKVTRDNLMRELSEFDEYSQYRWNKNKGYGTRFHREAILKFGITRHHRRQFVETFLRNTKK